MTPTVQPTPVRAVVFDWGGTITPWHAVDLREQWAVFARGMGAIACSLNDTAAAVLRAEDDAWRRGREQGTSARLDEILVAAGLDPAHPATEAGLAAYRDFWEPHTLTHPAIPPLWEWLRDNDIRVGVLSNTIWTRDYHRGIFERDGVLQLVDGDVYSSETPWVKPRREIFEAAAAAVGVEPAHCVYVGDRSYEDVHGPQSAGMRAVWIPHSDIPESQQVSHAATPDAIAHELGDITDIVTAWQHGKPLPTRVRPDSVAGSAESAAGSVNGA
ncbi:MAG TPA: HAD family hydrolase [Dermatophilaceae bacterium]|nr:HAD family hydrolase [Dermatophilaceae bacterium]